MLDNRTRERMLPASSGSTVNQASSRGGGHLSEREAGDRKRSREEEGGVSVSVSRDRFMEPPQQQHQLRFPSQGGERESSRMDVMRGMGDSGGRNGGGGVHGTSNSQIRGSAPPPPSQLQNRHYHSSPRVDEILGGDGTGRPLAGTADSEVRGRGKMTNISPSTNLHRPVPSPPPQSMRGSNGISLNGEQGSDSVRPPPSQRR